MIDVQVRDTAGGLKVLEREEGLQKELGQQLFIDRTGLDVQERYLLEIIMGALETLSGDDQQCWLLIIQAARVNRMPKEIQATSTVTI